MLCSMLRMSWTRLIMRCSSARWKPNIRVKPVLRPRLPTTSLVDETRTYGRDDDKKTIIEWLLSDKDNTQLSIISIVGMGGLGKTTLAQLVYNDRMAIDEFDLKAWVCVSDEFDVLRVTRTIYEAITMSRDDTNDLNVLQIKLKQRLSQKRFLIVLDDVWNENFMLWEALQSPFNHGAPGSKILLTTRSAKVVSTMRSSKIHSLKPLSEGDSWLLLSEYAFHGRDALSSSFDLEEIGRRISKKCKGLPLALKAIGSLLYAEFSLVQWTGILKNYDFDKERLIQLWMAENFLPCAHQSKVAREVGEQFFHDLLSRSFFQQSMEDETRFVMHDLINDLAKVEYGKFCHLLLVDEENNLTKMTRHVSYLRTFYEYSNRFAVMCQASKLRTFLPLSMQGHRSTSHTSFFHCISFKVILDLVSKFRCMRVLSLSGYHHIVSLPDSIGNLKHLRFLDLSGTKIKKLPDSICQLFHLQTLKLWRCRDLKKLPMDVHKLMNLRYLDFRETGVREMPKQLSKLKNLQVLSSFIVDKCGQSNIKQLKEFNLCGSVSILELQNVVSPADALAVI
ncbi:putative disease resistance RPP13-like protein 1 [Prosopis cineraria]|uniref:putative disease resistance RPP13-like protein 1 n=1 Tax=Prosopis cineraria TaxID=364024 RepID=UPI0024108A38|nr:putative disease resistance RPP13-like protein 1 [Prosopis cineraria]